MLKFSEDNELNCNKTGSSNKVYVQFTVNKRWEGMAKEPERWACRNVKQSNILALCLYQEH